MRKRFIAGARCPQCQLEDRIVIFQLAEEQYIECVSCGFKQSELNKKTDTESDKKSNEIVIKWPMKRNKKPLD